MNEEALYERIAQLEAENLKLKKQLLATQKKIVEFERRLLAYENAHTPPSLSKKKREPKEPSGKLGALKGHVKYERQEPEPTETVEHKLGVCPSCQHKLKKAFKIERRLIEEIPEPQPIQVTEHLIYHYQCSHCNKQVTVEHDLPEGSFGWNLQAHVTLLKYADRLPLRKVSEALQRQFGVNLTNTGILKITNRVSKLLQKEYQKQVQLIRTCQVVYVDETEIKVNGKTFWIWVFVGLQQTIFIIQKSRSKKVIEEVLGKNFTGVISCDGWTAYKQYSSNLQRCWAHSLREAKELKEKHSEFSVFYKNIKNLFAEIKEIRSKPPDLKKRQSLKQKLEKRMQYMLDAMDSHKTFQKFAVKLRNGLPYWFTCITNLLVEPTNNIAERALRELIVQRKIIGGLRREKGAVIMQTIHTMLATWKQQNLPLYPTLKKHLTC